MWYGLGPGKVDFGGGGSRTRLGFLRESRRPRTGLGLIGFRQDADFRDLSANGLGFSGRLGYEFGTGGVVVAPYVGYVRGLGGARAKADGDDTSSDVVISNFQFGLSIAAP